MVVVVVVVVYSSRQLSHSEAMVGGGKKKKTINSAPSPKLKTVSVRRSQLEYVCTGNESVVFGLGVLPFEPGNLSSSERENRNGWKHCESVNAEGTGGEACPYFFLLLDLFGSSILSEIAVIFFFF